MKTLLTTPPQQQMPRYSLCQPKPGSDEVGIRSNSQDLEQKWAKLLQIWSYYGCLKCRKRPQGFLLVPAGLKVSSRGGEPLLQPGAAGAGGFPCAVTPSGARRMAAPWDCRAGGVADLPCVKSVGKNCGRSESRKVFGRVPWAGGVRPVGARAGLRSPVCHLHPEEEADLGARSCRSGLWCGRPALASCLGH